MEGESEQEEAEAVVEEVEEGEERKSLVSSTHLSCSEYSANTGESSSGCCFLSDHKRLGLPLCCHGYMITSRSVATVSVTVALAALQTVTHTAIDANPHLPPTQKEEQQQSKEGQDKIEGFAPLPTQNCTTAPAQAHTYLEH